MSDSIKLEDIKHNEEISSESNTSSSETETRSPLDLMDQTEVENLVRIVSSRQQTSSVDNTKGDQTNNSGWSDLFCDATAPDFDLRKWLRRTMQILDQEGIQMQELGVVFKDLNVSGSGSALQLQKTLSSTFADVFRPRDVFMRKHGTPRRILRNLNGLLKPGEMVLVLGRPGAGCSTMLKTICGEIHGLTLENKGAVRFNGISQSQMIKEFKGEVVYNQEVEKHFPNLTVGQTLEFAAATRTPSNRPAGMTRNDFVKLGTKVIMAIFGLTHTYNTKVGNDFIRGVSGGERKRVSIAEMALAGAPVGAWDNSTRGLDSATALKFVQSLRLFSDLMGATHLVAAYQASQSIYDLFDKVIVLYEGRQIFYGPGSTAKEYFERQGWECPPRQTTGDFLTSVTNPQERRARPGMERIVPRTADEFEAYWQQSKEYQQLQADIDAYETAYPVIDGDKGSGEALMALQHWKQETQAKHTRPVSSFRISVPMQIRLNIKRAYQRIWNDMASTVSNLGGQVIIALVISSVFYNPPDDSSGIEDRCATLFFAVMLNALSAMNEINSLYSQRPIVEKHASYAFYHPFTEAIAGVLSDIPLKFAMTVVFNMILYFMTNLRREANHFFLYFLVTFVITLTMSMIFRTLAAVTKTISQAMTLAGVMVLSLVIYAGFVLPVPSMHPWFEWIHYLNPIYYSFEIVMGNEFHNRQFPCAAFIPSYANFTGDTFVCATASSVAGELSVSGDRYIWDNYKYSWDHAWRNFGIVLAFLVASLIMYIFATEWNSSATSTAEVLVFRRGHEPDYMRENKAASSNDEENSEKPDARPIRQPTAQNDDDPDDMAMIVPQTDIFSWRDVCYDIEIKGEPRRLLDHVSGWVKPGTLTALMGVSGAGKTTLLDVLAHRTSMGVITGDMFVNGRDLDASFQRKTGYVQQQDLHLATATVRESLRFSALLRQPASVSIEEKHQYVEEVIKMLKMEDFAEAVVGVPGEGLNVEQRKLLTIGVELAAKPKLLLFLDEPTSGLDSQSSWAICTFLRKLASMGQAVLCTIHQPSAILFQQFDQLLFLARGGKTVYYGPIGENSCTMLEYFERNGGRKCEESENPAEYMLDVVNLGANAFGENWFDVWKQSKEFTAVQEEIDRIHQERSAAVAQSDADSDISQTSEFAMPFWFQLYQVTYRVFQQYWRMPDYVIAKWGLGTVSGLFIGFSFYQAKTSMQGMETILYSLFMLCTIFSSIVQQIMPLFITQRSLYEVRERPSKAYSWKAFLIANIFVEIPYQIIMALLVFACYYFPTVGIQTSAQQGLVLLLTLEFFIYGGTFAQMIIAALPDTETASAVVLLLFALSLTFCGIMQSPAALPGFWIFMYRVSPFTYWVGGMASAQLHGREVVCSSSETSVFNPPAGQTCQQYMAEYINLAGGQLQNPNATSDCRYCSLTVADEYLAASDIYYDQRWRNFGLLWVYIFFNIFIATSTYYLFRVRKWNLDGLKERFAKTKKQ